MIFFKGKDIALDLMSLPTQQEYDKLLGLIEDLDPGLIGISVRSSFFGIAKEITERIHQKLGKPVIWGGTHATVAPEESIKFADMICLGEGEYPLLELAQRLADNRNISGVQNLWIKTNGRIEKNPLRPLIEDLDLLPFPDYVDGDKYYIENDQVFCQDPGLLAFNLDVLTSRGCPYHCSYCSNSIFCQLYKGKGSLVRLRSAQNVLGEIKANKKFLPKLRRVDFIDEVFSWNKAWVEEFVTQYNREIGLPFHCMQHPITIDREIMGMLKDAGLERVEIGIQSGSERVRKEVFERPVSDSSLVKTGQIMKELRIVPFYDIIVDNPFETQEDKKKGLELLLKIPRPYYMHMFSLIYFPNTTLTLKALEAKLISQEQVEGQLTKCFDQWYVSLKHPRPAVDRFWISLYSLASKRFVPKTLIKVLSRIRYLQKHPGLLVAFANMCNIIKLSFIAMKYLSEGKPVFSSLKKRGKSKKMGSRII